MPDSQRVIYEHQFLITANRCLKEINQIDNKELHQQLTEIISAKQTTMPITFWHATFGSPEFEKLTALDNISLPLEFRAEVVHDIQAALTWLNGLHLQLGAPTLDIDSGQLELHYQRLQQYPYLGQLFFTVSLLTRDLTRATQALQQRLDKHPVCFQNKPSDTGRILHTVFTKFYVGRIQPYLAKTYREGEVVIQTLERMLQIQQTQTPDSFQTYAQRYLSTQPNSLWYDFEQSIQAHTKIWQRLLTQCGMMPGAS
ncbi:MAG: DUF3080 family protein [Pseudomonadota bacterium]